jgi:hypothetical protein
VVLRVRGSTGSLGKLTLQRDCGVSWRYQAITLTTPETEQPADHLCNGDVTPTIRPAWDR